LGRSLAMSTLSVPFKNPICLPYRLFIYVHSFSREFQLQFWVRVANPQSWGRGGRMGGNGTARKSVGEFLYRPFMVTFPLSLRVSAILPLLFFSTPLFPYPTSSLPKISPCSPGSRWVVFGYKQRSVGLLLSVRLVSKISDLCDHYPPTSQTDGQTDGGTTCDRKTALCTKVHCAVKINIFPTPRSINNYI